MFKLALYIMFISSLVSCSHQHNRHSTKKLCSPPLGDECVEIDQCPFFIDILNRTSIPRSRGVIKLIRKHHCGFDRDVPKVCCPAVHKEYTKSDRLISESTNESEISNHENLNLLPLNGCGPIYDEFRIISRYKAVPLEFPWMVLLAHSVENGFDYGCGGTLINDAYVLTAAHCASLSIAWVRLGEHNLETPSDCNKIRNICTPPVQDVSVKRIIVHEDYDASTFNNDIALLRLARKVNFTQPHIQPICLPIDGSFNVDLDRRLAIVTGWGVTETGFKSTELRKAQIPIVPNDVCQRAYEKNIIRPEQVCAGGVKGRDSCAGDSGGPLILAINNGSTARYVQYGIVSFGPKFCGIKGKPAVYTRVTPYIKWILDNIATS